MMANRPYSTKPAPRAINLPLQPRDYPRLFRIAYHASRAAGVLHERITRDGSGHFNFVFNRGGQLITCTLSNHRLIAAGDPPLIRDMALEIMRKDKR